MGAAFEALHETDGGAGDEHEHAVPGGVAEHEQNAPEKPSVSGDDGEKGDEDRR